MKVIIGDHPLKQYNERRMKLGIPPIEALSLRDEIVLLLMFSQPCELPDEIVQDRFEHNDGVEVEYWHTHPFRFVVHTLSTGDKKLFTVDPDIHPGKPGMWRNVEEYVRLVNFYGFTIEEITGGSIPGLTDTLQRRDAR